MRLHCPRRPSPSIHVRPLMGGVQDSCLPPGTTAARHGQQAALLHAYHVRGHVAGFGVEVPRCRSPMIDKAAWLRACCPWGTPLATMDGQCGAAVAAPTFGCPVWENQRGRREQKIKRPRVVHHRGSRCDRDFVDGRALGFWERSWPRDSAVVRDVSAAHDRPMKKGRLSTGRAGPL
jgi:hypothetical protein